MSYPGMPQPEQPPLPYQPMPPYPPTAQYPPVAPLSGPPLVGPPMSGPPLPGPPMSGPPMYAPVTAMPATGRRTPAVPLLAGLAALFFLVAVVFVTLYVTKSGAYSHQVTLVSQRDKSITDDLQQIDSLKQQLQSTKDQLNDAQQQQSGTQNQLDEVTKEKQVISNCLNLYNKVVEALINNDKNTFNSTFPTMKTACDEASRYVS